ncbi:hypothetical protein BGX34_012038 [Mortierella sp. NVP85]|nr:hypothetical protein BGX34_012038 [Mortierella sp. NVP85]
MTVAKLEPALEGIGPRSPSSSSPPGSPLSAKTSVFTTTTTTTTTTRTTATSNASSKNAAKHDQDSADDAKRSRPKLGPKMNPIYKGLRALVWALYFNLGATLISMTQILSLPLAVLAPGVYRRHIKRTSGHFGSLLLRMNQLFAPSDIVLTGDESIKGIVRVYQGKQLKGEDGGKSKYEFLLDMPDRLVLISNHQGMRLLDFILLKRNNWAHDKHAIEENLGRASKDEPLWLVVFPEGTVVSRSTRKRSMAFAEKTGLTDHRHLLLPRTSGMFVCVNQLRGSVEYIYDFTVGYSGIHYGEIPQELYPLPGLYVNKAQPKDINMHLRRFAIKDIPESEPEFVEWVRARWREKDDLMEEFYTTGKFPSQLTSEDIGDSGDKKEGVSIRIPLKLRSVFDYVSYSGISLLALPVVAMAIRYALQNSA